MAFQSVPDCASCFVGFTQNAVPIGFTLYFQKSGGYTETDLEDLAADMDAWVSDELLPILSNNIVYNEVTVRGLENEEDFEVVNSTSAGAGTVAENGLPNSVTLAIARLSGFTGRSARGRIYLPGIPEGALGTNENEFLNADVNTWVAVFLEILNYAITHGWIEVIISRVKDGLKRSEGVAFAVEGWEARDNKVDTQRRRLK